jgi:hypothetical protein
LNKIKNFTKLIYKKASYILTSLIYGRINGVILPNNFKDILLDEIKIQKNYYKIYLCINSKIYTDTIHDTAILKDNKIIEGPSFQYRNNINVGSKYNKVFLTGTPRLKKKIRGTIFSLLVGGAGNANYWHWLFDVLPKLHLLKLSNLIVTKLIFFYFLV